MSRGHVLVAPELGGYWTEKMTSDFRVLTADLRFDASLPAPHRCPARLYRLPGEVPLRRVLTSLRAGPLFSENSPNESSTLSISTADYANPNLRQLPNEFVNACSRSRWIQTYWSSCLDCSCMNERHIAQIWRDARAVKKVTEEILAPLTKAFGVNPVEKLLRRDFIHRLRRFTQMNQEGRRTVALAPQRSATYTASMSAVSLKAHYDGERIVLDEPFDLPPNSPLIVTVISEAGDPAADRAQWTALSTLALARAYSDLEPDYTLSDLER